MMMIIIIIIVIVVVSLLIVIVTVIITFFRRDDENNIADCCYCQRSDMKWSYLCISESNIDTFFFFCVYVTVNAMTLKLGDSELLLRSVQRVQERFYYMECPNKMRMHEC